MTSINGNSGKEKAATSNLDEVSKNLKAAMKERGRRRQSQDGGWEFAREEEADGYGHGRTEDGRETPLEQDESFTPEEAKKDI